MPVMFFGIISVGEQIHISDYSWIIIYNIHKEVPENWVHPFQSLVQPGSQMLPVTMRALAKQLLRKGDPPSGG